MPPDSLRQQAFYELRIFDISPLHAVEIAAKLRTIVSSLERCSRPPDSQRLTFRDLEAIQRVERAMVRRSTREVLEESRKQTALPNLAAIAKAVLDTHAIFQHEICPQIYSDFRCGDAIFYDLQNRQRIGLEMSPSMMLSLQKAYDRFSHSGLYLEDGEGNPALFHGLRNKLKRLSWLDAAYMPRRQLDLAKIFVGFATLLPDDQQRVLDTYEQSVRQLGQAQDDYEFDPPSLITGLSMFFTQRVFTQCPAVVSRRGRKAKKQLALMGAGAIPMIDSGAAASTVGSSAESSGEYGTPEKGAESELPDAQAAKASSVDGPGSPSQSEATMDRFPADDTASLVTARTDLDGLSPSVIGGDAGTSIVPWEPPEATVMLCSGFTAAILVECMREVQRLLPELQRALAFTPEFSVDVERMTPGDLHNWPIWKTWTDDEIRADRPRFYIFADEVFLHWFEIDRTWC